MLLDQQSAASSGSVYGFYTDDTIVAGLGDKYLAGLGGNDTYVYSHAGGNISIEDGTSSSTADRLVLTDINSADVTVTRMGSSDNVVLSVTGGGSITLAGELSSFGYSTIEAVQFANGVTWTAADIRAIIDQTSGVTHQGTNGSDTINATSGNDVIDGRAGNDLLRGGAGSDTYLYRSGDGTDYLDDELGSTSEVDILRLLDLNASDITLSRSGAHAIVTVNGSGATITLDEQFYSSAYYGFERIEFADGTFWDRDQIRANAWIGGTSGADTINGTADSETFFGMGGNDLLRGWTGSDTYVYRSGDGSDYIDDEFGSTSETDVLRLTDLNASDVTLSRSGVHAILTVNATGATVTFDEEFYNSAYWGIDRIDFADGTSWDRTQIRANAWMRGTGVADTMNGTGDSETFFGMGGNDLLRGWTGSDTYVYRAGDGSDYIDDEFRLHQRNRRAAPGGLEPGRCDPVALRRTCDRDRERNGRHHHPGRAVLQLGVVGHRPDRLRRWNDLGPQLHRKSRVTRTSKAHTRPYTGTMPPRVTLLSGEARKAIVRATSSTLGQAAWSAPGIAWRFAGVSRIEGATALTRMSSFATSSASATVSAATAALLAA